MPTWTILSSSFFLPFSLTFSPATLCPQAFRTKSVQGVGGGWLSWVECSLLEWFFHHGCRKISTIFPLVFYSCPFLQFCTLTAARGSGEFLQRFAISHRVIQTLAGTQPKTTGVTLLTLSAFVAVCCCRPHFSYFAPLQQKNFVCHPEMLLLNLIFTSCCCRCHCHCS